MEDIGISLSGLIAQLVNFFILFGILFLLLYKPVMRMLRERSEKIKDSMEQAEQIKERLAQTEQQVREQVEAARRDGQSIVAQAGQIGEQLKDAARQEARQEAEVIVARARVEIDRERDAAIDELRRQFTDLAIMAAEKVINETLDKERHRRIIDEVLEQAPRGKD
jgi:F-type H+-transporting ATPase subunit b